MSELKEQMLRYLEGTLPEKESQELERRLDSEPDLKAEFRQLQSLQGLLQTSRADSFAPYFSDRVMKKLQPQAKGQTAESFYDSLSWIFKRAAFACMIGAVALGTVNVLDYQGLGLASSVVEALFGLPSASITDALTYGAV